MSPEPTTPVNTFQPKTAEEWTLWSPEITAFMEAAGAPKDWQDKAHTYTTMLALVTAIRNEIAEMAEEEARLWENDAPKCALEQGRQVALRHRDCFRDFARRIRELP